MTKRRLIDDPTSCLSKAADDEPLFVLRASDKLAPVLVRMWMELAHLHGAPPEKVAEAAQLSIDMQRWAHQNRGGGKWPD